MKFFKKIVPKNKNHIVLYSVNKRKIFIIGKMLIKRGKY